MIKTTTTKNSNNMMRVHGKGITRLRMEQTPGCRSRDMQVNMISDETAGLLDPPTLRALTARLSVHLNLYIS